MPKAVGPVGAVGALQGSLSFDQSDYVHADDVMREGDGINSTPHSRVQTLAAS